MLIINAHPKNQQLSLCVSNENQASSLHCFVRVMWSSQNEKQNGCLILFLKNIRIYTESLNEDSLDWIKSSVVQELQPAVPPQLISLLNTGLLFGYL